MKFLKKTAALLFCVALALSVMAVSAMAEGEDPTGGYSVTLTPTNDSIKDHDSNAKYEIVASDTQAVTYDIMLRCPTEGKKINAFYFTFGTEAALTETVTIGYLNGGSFVDKALKEGAHSYAFYPAASGNEDITTTTDSNGVKVGTISLAVGAVTTDPTFTLSNIHLSERTVTENSTTISADYALTDVTQADLEVKNETYTITFTPKKNTDGTNVIATDTTFTATYDFLTGHLTGNGASNNVLKAAAELHGYDFDKWSVTDSNSGGWATTYADGATIAARNFGDVSMVADYNIVTYTITYNYKETVNGSPYDYSSLIKGAENGLPTTANSTAKTSYTVENLASNGTSDFLNLTDMARKGYTLTGWTAENASGNVTVANVNDPRAVKTGEYNTAAWNTLVNNALTTTGLVGAYGNVTITPHWELIGKVARDSYQYTYTGEEIVLFAVPTVSVSGTYTLKADDTAYTLYQVGASKYTNSFGKTTGSYTSDSLDANVDYTVFASIIPTSATTLTFAVTESDSDRNALIAYTGKVFGAGTLNAADYGNANTMLGNKGIFNNTAVSIEERLKIDRYDATGEATAESAYGSILDVKAIIDQVFG